MGPAIALVTLVFVCCMVVVAAVVGAVVFGDVPHELTGIHLV